MDTVVAAEGSPLAEAGKKAQPERTARVDGRDVAAVAAAEEPRSARDPGIAQPEHEGIDRLHSPASQPQEAAMKVPQIPAQSVAPGPADTSPVPATHRFRGKSLASQRR